VQIDWIAKSMSVRPDLQNFIDGQRRPIGGSPIDKISPRDGALLCRFGSGVPSEAAAAVAVARRAFEDGRWSKLSARRRMDVLYKLSALIEAHAEEFALLECLDVGKPISEAAGWDVPAAAAIVKFNAEAADKLYGSVYAVDTSSLSFQLRRPIGVIAGIVGWNFPLVLAVTKMAPVLAAGNSLVLKPSEFTSFSTGRLAALALEAGVPEGVFNVVHGNSAVGAALGHDRDVDLLTFTGSTLTGNKHMVAAGQSNMKRLVLECGGKAPNIVFEDCPDLDAVADGIVARSFWNQGQVCTASSRVLIQQSIKDELLPKIIERTAALGLGDPLDPATRFGAVVSREHQRKVLGYIESGVAEGAAVVFQSRSPVPHAGGFYVSPVIFDEVSPRQRIAREEIFGPVLSIMSFTDESEAIRIANDTMYGLSAIVWTRDLGRALRLTQGIHAGWVSVNATAKPGGGPAEGEFPVGGHRQSGFGVEGGIEGLAAYTAQTCVQWFT
jgi:acyl-CoA reductase-like NAD-dependent aldehyde dehydrogenase